MCGRLMAETPARPLPTDRTGLLGELLAPHEFAGVCERGGLCALDTGAGTHGLHVGGGIAVPAGARRPCHTMCVAVCMS